MNNNRETIMYVLEACYPDDIEFTSPSIIDGIIDGVRFSSTETSSNISMMELIDIFENAVETIVICIRTYEFLKKSLQREPISKEVKSELSKKDSVVLQNDKSDEIINSLIEYYLRKKD